MRLQACRFLHNEEKEAHKRLDRAGDRDRRDPQKINGKRVRQAPPVYVDDGYDIDIDEEPSEEVDAFAMAEKGPTRKPKKRKMDLNHNICRHYYKWGNCRYGNDCIYAHVCLDPEPNVEQY